jgi:hypothetical protein
MSTFAPVSLLKSAFHRRLTSAAGRVATLAAGAFLATPACASEPKPLPASIDPANADAPESPRPMLTALAAPAEKPEKPEDKGPAAVTYTCPMHPEVVSDKPGRCPKCGMKLVPKDPATPGGKK